MTLANQLRAFGPVGILAMLAIVLAGNPLGAVLALLWVFATETSWRDLGFVRPTSWPRTVVAGIVAGVALKLLLKAAVMPLLGAPAVNASYQSLTGNAAALAVMLPAVIVGGGFNEELVWRGFLFERLGKLLGRGSAVTVATIVITSLLFGLRHYWEQGIWGAIQATITGLTFGASFAITRRIWGIMIAHAAYDVTAVLMIYWNLERPVATFFSR